MCGRTACTLDKHGIQKASCPYSKTKEPPAWIQKYDWQNYQPSYNLAPSQISPVLVNSTTLSLKELDEVVLFPMRWGLIPSWYKGSLEGFTLKTNNCRQEGILEKPTYRGPATAGRRCVILADGFYEWKICGSKQKQPYFIYFPQEEGPDVFTQKLDISDDVKYNGPRLLTMAGLFDTWKSSENEVIYSYSVVTMDASKTASFVHSRMPAILENEDEVSMWLDSQRVPVKKALSILKPIENLQMHPVSTLVNNSRNNSIDCIKPMSLEKKVSPMKTTGLTAWLKRGQTDLGNDAKHFKKEN
ncbi:abasic site processing protein HMCES-like [Uloborus diversus]|uniref:abasic site processing protein HMCES-like n=1 Tax=Uloborus diversus TaxID=327109 RepID=UPI00240A5D25|nr:abasic site processing protein HMCES-like [Uloborus diversus]